MSFSKSEFIDGFISETKEHLEKINNDIIVLKNNHNDFDCLQDLLRELHTVKGTARMLGFLTIEKVAHGIEDVFKGIRENKYELTERIVQLTFVTTDLIKRLTAKITENGMDNIDVKNFLEVYKKASAGLFFTTEVLDAENHGFAENSDLINLSDENENLENISSIRIEISRINELIKSFDNIIIRQFRFKKQLDDLENRFIENGTKDLREFPRQLKEDMSLIENAIFKTQHQILNLRMLPLDIVLSPLKKEIEEDAYKLNKQIYFDIPKTDFMLDKVILEHLRNILLHLVRNSLDHGIESPEERKSKNKTEKGNISIYAQKVTNHIIITVSDDGRGIQYEKVRNKAKSLYPEQIEEINKMNDKQLQQFIFTSGFTTKETSTSLSGRGIGLDVVRSDMEKIKGKIKVKSTENTGTSFELTIPLSLATEQGLFVISAETKFLIPSHYIAEITDITQDDITSLQGQNYVSLHNQLIPLYYLSSLLGEIKTEKASSIIVVEYLETQIAIVVDIIDKYELVVVNPLPKLLKNMKSLQGVVYDENYSIIPILNIPDIMQRMKSILAYDIKKYKSKNAKDSFVILVVDDSLTTREIEKTIFESNGFTVESASDGICALDILRTKHIDVVVTDIKMPRMDGLVLLDNINHEYPGLPVIVVSGVYDQEEKNRFIGNGAKDFIVKSDFERGNLLDAVKRFKID